MDVQEIAAEVASEVERARKLHAPYNSLHEAYAVLMEEVDEFWDHVKLNQKRRVPDEIRKELTHIAAVAIRAIADLHNTEYRK